MSHDFDLWWIGAPFHPLVQDETWQMQTIDDTPKGYTDMGFERQIYIEIVWGSPSDLQ
jgi:hypothetical protein